MYLKETFFPFFFANPLQFTKKGCEQKTTFVCARVPGTRKIQSRQAWNSYDLFSAIMFRVFVPTITNLRNTKQTKYFLCYVSNKLVVEQFWNTLMQNLYKYFFSVGV